MLSCLQISEEKQFLVSLNPLLPYTHTFYTTLDLYPPQKTPSFPNVHLLKFFLITFCDFMLATLSILSGFLSAVEGPQL